MQPVRSKMSSIERRRVGNAGDAANVARACLQLLQRHGGCKVNLLPILANSPAEALRAAAVGQVALAAQRALSVQHRLTGGTIGTGGSFARVDKRTVTPKEAGTATTRITVATVTYTLASVITGATTWAQTHVLRDVTYSAAPVTRTGADEIRAAIRRRCVMAQAIVLAGSHKGTDATWGD